MLKVLGLTWRMEQGDFIFDLRNLMDFLKDKKKHKKRCVTSCCMYIRSYWVSFSFYHQSEVSFSENLGTWSWMGWQSSREPSESVELVVHRVAWYQKYNYLQILSCSAQGQGHTYEKRSTRLQWCQWKCILCCCVSTNCSTRWWVYNNSYNILNQSSAP